MRKNLLLIYLLAMTNLVFAQVPDCSGPSPLNEQFSQMLKNLNKSQVPTGILYENVFPWAELESYDGTSNTDTSSYQHYMQAYSELYYAKFNTNGLVHPSDFETAITNFHPDKEFHHAYGIIDYQFNTIKPNALTNNLLYLSHNKLYDVQSRSQSPYLTKNTKIGSILLGNESGKMSVGTHYIHFSPDFVQTNTGFSLNSITGIKIFKNGVLIVNQAVNGLANVVIPIIIDLTVSPIVIVLTIGVGIVYAIHKIYATPKPVPYTDICSGEDTIEVTGDSFDGGYGIPAYGAKGKANIYYAYGNCATKRITKPIIFVDGFDPTNENHGPDLYSFYINASYLSSTGVLLNLGDELRSQGYDIITFDQSDEGLNRGGGGLMENNSLALAKFLETLYELHKSTLQQDFVLVGASMGGLISRYALTYMEHNNKPHHTRLFISFDSPQLGAQIPVGVQQFIDIISVYGGLKATKKVKAAAVHLTDAARQLLLHHSSTKSETIQADNYRAIFLNNLNNLGSWPVLCRKIAIADGNRNGILKSTSPPPPVPTTFEAMYSCDYELDFGIKHRLSKNCTSASCYKMHSQSYTQTSGARCKSLDFTVNNNTPLLKMVFGGAGNFTTQSLYTQNQNNTSYDIAPGAKFGVNPLNIVDNWAKVFGAIITGHLRITKNLIPHTNFIPTVSSVAYSFPNNEPFNIYKNLAGITLSRCAGTTPFDTAYAPSKDLNHVEITEEIANWFRNEIYYPKPISICSLPCQDYVNLSNPLPNNANQTYKAAKAINLLPNFEAKNGSVIKAQIGCNSTQAAFDYSIPTKDLTKNQTKSTTCPFDWDVANNQVICSTGFTNFRVFIKNIDINTYAEFSTNGNTWTRANIGDNGWDITLNSNPGQLQVFYARAKNNPTNTLQGWLGFCN